MRSIFFDAFFLKWLSDILRRVYLRFDIGMPSDFFLLNLRDVFGIVRSSFGAEKVNLKYKKRATKKLSCSCEVPSRFELLYTVLQTAT